MDEHEPLSATEINARYQTSRPRLVINRRHLRTQQMLAMVLHHLRPILERCPDRDAYKDAARVLEDLFHAAGTYIVTDADRAAAGCPMRDHNGLTLDELVIIEQALIAAMAKQYGFRMEVEADGKPHAVKIKPDEQAGS